MKDFNSWIFFRIEFVVPNDFYSGTLDGLLKSAEFYILYFTLYLNFVAEVSMIQKSVHYFALFAVQINGLVSI